LEDTRFASAVAQKLWRDKRRAARESDGLNGLETPGSPLEVGFLADGKPRANILDTFSVVIMARCARKQNFAGYFRAGLFFCHSPLSGANDEKRR
jgi:hypothetical protein